MLVELLGSERLGKSAEHPDCTLTSADRALLQTVYCSMTDFCVPIKEPEISVSVQLLTRIGRAVDTVWQDTLQLLGFVGLIMETIARNLLRPKRWRTTPMIAHIEQTGLDAAPIVALLTFLVGAVVAFLGATVLASFGATILPWTWWASRSCASSVCCSRRSSWPGALPVPSLRRSAR